MPDLNLKFERDDKSLALLQTWISGEGGDVEFRLSSGAGLGTGQLVLDVTHNDKRARWNVNIAKFLPAFVDAAVKEMKDA